MHLRSFASLLTLSLCCAAPVLHAQQQTDSTQQVKSTERSAPQRWTEARANAWYAKQPWLVGANFVPDDAINQLEMWQAATFDPKEIDKELGWAQSIGMNTMRVFLHDLLWEQDPAGFKQRINTFLTIAAKHHIRPVFVIFDSCWDPMPKLGPQHPPIPGVHNSGWVQSPGAAALEDPKQYPRLKTYVTGIIGAFADDKRILAWDLWNVMMSEWLI
jgi:endo-1,4-beta-mannosidase